MARNPNALKVGPQGRIVLPAAVRNKLDIKPGDELLLLIEDGHIVLLTRDQLWAKIRERFKDVPAGVSLADELIAERRAEAKRESEEQ
ncbi:MAG: AbrB/MazE/SpoVT family DNA-binding domain-containing protein [Chloroflexi bacterium]|nr:AbrB/MazE/SpoVT family DNA-binding domain-containing protein [Chloroflexota bacterium]